MAVAVSEEVQRTERVMLGVFASIRAVNVMQAVLCVSRGATGYRRPRVAKILAAAAVVESIALFARALPDGAFVEPDLMWADAVFGIGALLAMAGITTPDGRTTSVNWALPYTVVTAGASRLSLSGRASATATGLLAGVYGATVRASLRRGGEGAGAAAANVFSYLGFHLGIGAAIRLFRGNAEELVAAHAQAVDRGQRLAAEAERNRQHRLLHDSALQTLEAVASSRGATDPSLRRRAAAEAVRLRRALSGRLEPANELVAGLEALVADAAELGVTVELTTEQGVGVDAECAAALHDAAREAITNVAKHSGQQSAVVRAASARGGVEVTIRDHGAGFDAGAAPAGFGVAHSINTRLREVGGRAIVWSEPGRGTRVTLWVPE